MFHQGKTFRDNFSVSLIWGEENGVRAGNKFMSEDTRTQRTSTRFRFSTGYLHSANCFSIFAFNGSVIIFHV